MMVANQPPIKILNNFTCFFFIFIKAIFEQMTIKYYISKKCEFMHQPCQTNQCLLRLFPKINIRSTFQINTLKIISMSKNQYRKANSFHERQTCPILQEIG